MRTTGLVLTALYLIAGCSSNDEIGAMLVIDQPSASETTYAEMRDFYVIGSYPEGVTRPGNIRMELFRGETASGTPIRTIQSQVDPTSCVTLESSLDLTYASGSNYGVTMVPDIVKEPNGLLDPNNKVVVTDTYYAGIILGGATKSFDTTYEGPDGTPLEDLTAGTYTVKVTGLSCDTQHMVATRQVHIGLTHASLGRFSPAASLAKLTAFANEMGYRIYLDNFPGYFAWKSNLYEIKNRWMPNNSIEVANDLEGTTIDNVAAARNDVLVYNVKPTSATNLVETAALVKNALTESTSTVWHFYDVGEPTLNYVDENGVTKSVEGRISDFAQADRHVLVRAEVQVKDGAAQENIYNVADVTPKAIDFDLSDGFIMTTADSFSLFGVVRAIPSSVTAGAHDGEYTIDDRITQMKYSVNLDGVMVNTVTKDLSLGRIYDTANPTTITYSTYEYKHQFLDAMAPGIYDINVIGLNTIGDEVAGTAETFAVTVE
jgi:hypothetical protein